ARKLLDAREKLSLIGDHQKHNAMVACAALMATGLHVRIEPRVVAKGLHSVFWPGRFQYLPSHHLILDGAHNPAGADALRQTFEQAFPDKQPLFVLSCFQNKDIPTMTRSLIR